MVSHELTQLTWDNVCDNAPYSYSVFSSVFELRCSWRVVPALCSKSAVVFQVLFGGHFFPLLTP